MPKIKLEKKLLYYAGKAISDYKMIEANDKVLACLSGGKDSVVLVYLLHLLQLRSNTKFDLQIFILDQNFPGFDATDLKIWLQEIGVPFEILKEDIYSILKLKAEPNRYCMLCSRLRRGIIYSYANKHGFNKIALGHHRDDLISSLLMSILYTGEIGSMPPKLVTKNKKNVVIRPLCYCQEQDILAYAKEKKFPINTGKICQAKENVTRQKIKKLIDDLAKENPKIPSNMLHALQRVRPSQLMDRSLWEF